MMNLPITDPCLLDGLVATDDADIHQYLRSHPGLHALVDLNDCIFSVKVQVADTRARRMLHELKRIVQKKTDQKVVTREITESVYTTVTHKQRLKPERAVSEGKDGNRLVEELLNMAIERGASDIHFRAWRCGSTTLLRINQILYPVSKGVEYTHAIRTIRAIFTAEQYGAGHFEPDDICDGSFQYPYQGGVYMVRLNTVNDVRGTTMVVRIRNPHEIIDINQAGLHHSQLASIEQIMALNGGLMIFTGPTNSGKSTSTTALVSKIPIERYVLEIGDPIEVYLPTVTHVELSREGEGAEARIARTFAATVRQDTDVLVLGEIRDILTAKASESMAIQGKFVLSTMHTESVITAVPRMIELGISEDVIHAPGFLVGLVSQKLIPVNCPECATSQPMQDRVRHHYYQQHLLGNGRDEGRLRYRNPEGCEACNHTGVGGQTLVAEVLEINREVRTLIAQRHYDLIEDYMWEKRILNKHRHALIKIREGLLDPSIVESRINPFTEDVLMDEWV